MTEEKKETKVVKKEAPKKAAKKATKKVSFAPGSKDNKRGGKGRRAGNERKPSEFEQTMVSIRRVTRVMGGGRRFSFSVAMVIGDKKGRVGIGTGKAVDTALAIEKAVKEAKRNLIKVPLTDTRSISREVSAKFASSDIFIKPTPGRGLSAGGAMRTVLFLAGITDVSAKIYSRSKNSLNNAKATVKALKKLEK